MLGITGFETSANYVEEQQRGVYVKTLRNTWAAVFVLNPILAIVTVGVLSFEAIRQANLDGVKKKCRF